MTGRQKNNRFRKAACALAASALALLGASSPPAQAQVPANPLEDRGGAKSTGIQIKLSVDHAPAVGENAALSFDAMPFRSAPALAIAWQLPDGGVLLDGPAAETLSPALRRATQTVTRRVRFDAPGIYRLIASASISPTPAETISASSVLFFHVTVDGRSRVTSKDEQARALLSQQPDVAITLDDSPTAVAAASVAAGRERAQSANGDPCFSVSGTVTRLDLSPTTMGYGTNTLPVPYTEVEIRESDLVFDDSYAKVATNSDGRFTASFCDDDGVFDDTLEIYVRVFARVWRNGHKVVTVSEAKSFLGIDLTALTTAYEIDSNEQSSGGGNLNYDFRLQNNRTQSAIFNITDSVYEAWQFWKDSGGQQLNSTVDVLWEPGEGQKGSNYRGDFFTGRDIVIADDPGEPDEWDDSVIMHEFGHMLDDHFSCDDNPGGKHTIDQIVDEDGDLLDLELAWGEGYPDYFQSAVRQARGDALASFYLDNNSTNNSTTIVRNLETYDTLATPKSNFNEMSIAAMLWDLNDSGVDSGGADDDKVSFGHAQIQRVYTNPAFASNGDVFDDTCTAPVFLSAWIDLGLPTTAAVADAVRRNVGTAFPIAPSLLTQIAATGDGIASVDTATGLPDAPNQPQYKWWKRHSVAVDTSASMAGLKLDAAKSVIVEQVNDLTKDPAGTEIGVFQFDNNSPAIKPVVEGRFFAEQVLPSINALGASGTADPNCPAAGLSALQQTALRQHDGQAWLITDGDDTRSLSVEGLRKQLNQQRMRGSVVLLAGCGTAATKQTDISGAEKDYLGLAADSKAPSGIAPYLLTALGSGGQFLFVQQSQLPDAVKILRAGLSNSAGAGRWSDYVADQPTYRYDELDSNEYRWIDTSTAAGGTAVGFSDVNGRVRLSTFLPQFAYKDGYIRLGLFVVLGGNPAYTDYNLLRGSLPWYRFNPGPSLAASAATQDGVNSAQGFWYQCTGDFTDCFQVEAKTEGEWRATTLTGWGGPGNTSSGSSGLRREIQMLQNSTTGETRYQYRSLAPGDSGIALIGVDGTGLPRITIANGDVGGAQNNRGYKLYTAPPQPSKTFTVEVDSLITGVGFLQTGYSGTFDRMIVRYPDGSEALCSDTANVLCVSLNNGLVQYVQVNVNGRGGTYTAVVDAGASGDGTFSFSALAASSVSAESEDTRMRSTVAARLTTRLGRAADGNTLSGWLQSPNGARFGSGFTLFDDGTHGDGRAGDGVFGSDPFAPGRAGIGYLWVSGAIGGVAFTRSDPVPYNFQPLRVSTPSTAANLGGITTLTYALENLDSVYRCYGSQVNLPEGWQEVIGFLPTGICLNPGASGNVFLNVRMSAGPADNTLPSGTAGDVTVTFTESEEGRITGNASTRVTRHRAPDHIRLINPASEGYAPLGYATPITLTAYVLDAEDSAVADGTPVVWSASAGTVTALSTDTANGRAFMAYTVPAGAGDYVIRAESGTLVATTTVRVRAPIGTDIMLDLNPTQLRGAASSSARVLVRDPFGQPAANAQIRVGIEQDGEHGAIGGGEVFTGTTNAQGELTVTFQKAATAGFDVMIRAELIANTGTGFAVLDEDRKLLQLARAVMYLPLASRK